MMPRDESPVRNIESVADWQRLIDEPRALLFVWFSWSMPAMRGRAKMTSWFARWRSDVRTPAVSLYLLDGDALPEFDEWNKTLLDDRGGNGSLYLFQHGNVVARFPSLIRAGLRPVAKACEHWFGERHIEPLHRTVASRVHSFVNKLLRGGWSG